MEGDSAPIEWITTREAADLTGYNLEYIRQMIRAGRIAAEKKGRDWWVDRDSIESHAAWLHGASHLCYWRDTHSPLSWKTSRQVRCD